MNKLIGSFCFYKKSSRKEANWHNQTFEKRLDKIDNKREMFFEFQSWQKWTGKNWLHVKWKEERRNGQKEETERKGEKPSEKFALQSKKTPEVMGEEGTSNVAETFLTNE